MCGIAGVLSLDGSPVRHAAVRAMTDALTHRGPDEGAIWMAGFDGAHGAPLVGLGHRRLRVIDLSPLAAQPMGDPEGRGILSYNGELYNAPDLRRELEGRGTRFRSRSDTEVVLHALLVWGEEALERFNGMFALAFWDERRRALLLARDRFGEKPLYYAAIGGQLRFASELGALAVCGGLPLEIDEEALELYLTFGFVPAPWSIYHSARKLPHGALLRAAPGSGPGVRRYYRLEERIRRSAPLSPAAAVRAALETAVRRRLAADVPVGAFLSGGIDSCAVVSLMRDALPAPPRTYSMAVPGSGYFDESGRARSTARRLGTRHREVPVDAAGLRAEIPSLLDALDEPFADSSSLAASLISREARREVTVALSGDGGDEVFGGYRLYRALASHRLLARLPPPAGALLARLSSLLPARHGGGFAGLLHRARKLLGGMAPELAGAHAAWMSILTGPLRRRLRPDAPDGDLGRGIVEERHRRFGGGLDAVLPTEIDLPLPDDMLAKVDRTSMRYALEVRAPFLDPDLVELALALPAREHFSPFAGKRLLRRALRDLLPGPVRRAPKRGFEVPIGDWLAGPLAERFREHARLLPGALPGAAPGVAEDWLREHSERRADRGRVLWALFALVAWHEGPRARHARAAQSFDESRSEVTVLRRSEG
jgi:asparagine synthase (glutamine-hydrolysing)